MLVEEGEERLVPEARVVRLEDPVFFVRE